MDRRKFLKVIGALGTGATASTAGCISFGGGNNVPPPRKSEVFDTVTALDETTIAVEFEPDVEVQSRAEINSNQSISEGNSGNSNSLLPVGVASAGGRGGRGATGRGRGGYSSAPRGRNGHKKWHGGDYDDWYEDHRNEVRWFSAGVAAVGIAYLGTEEQFAENAPGAGPVGWDETWRNQDFEGDSLTYNTDREGWYRIGSRLVRENGDYNFGWEAVDAKFVRASDSASVSKTWKISPRL